MKSKLSSISKLAVVVAMFSALPLAQAEESVQATAMTGPASTEANIYQGNWNLGGSFAFTKYNGGRNDQTVLHLSPFAEYFVVDHLSAGLSFGYDKASEDTGAVATFGPAADYYFWSGEKAASYVGASFETGLTDQTVKSVTSGRVGVQYFVSRAVGVGPSFVYEHLNGHRDTYNRYGFHFGLGVYL